MSAASACSQRRLLWWKSTQVVTAMAMAKAAVRTACQRYELIIAAQPSTRANGREWSKAVVAILGGADIPQSPEDIVFGKPHPAFFR